MALGWRASPSAGPKFWALGQASLLSGACIALFAVLDRQTFNQPDLQPALLPKVNTHLPVYEPSLSPGTHHKDLATQIYP